MKRYQHILIPFDGSQMSGEALVIAETLAKSHGAHITLLYVHDKSADSNIWDTLTKNDSTSFLSSQTNVDVAPLPHPPTEKRHPSQAGNDTERNIENEVFAQAKGLMSSEVSVDYQVIEGEPIKKIIQFTADKKVDLIVIGTRPQGGFRKSSMDTLTQRIANETDCSIFIVK